MHISLESLNHILTVITVTAFVYSRKDYFKDIVESDLLPGKIENKVEGLSREIESRIEEQISNNKKQLLGFESEIFDLDNPEIQELLRVKTAVLRIKENFTSDYHDHNNVQNNAIQNINNRFKNTSFYIALVSFVLLIVAACFPHEQFMRLEIFLFFYNIINLLFLIRISRRVNNTNNRVVLFNFIVAIILSIATVVNYSLANAVYAFLKELKPIQYIKNIIGQPVYSELLLVTLLILLLPWIYCFVKFTWTYLKCYFSVRASEKPYLEKLKKYRDFLDTKEEMKK